MSSKITSEHLCRGAVVYIRQSSPAQVLENTESQRRQYALAEVARAAGFASVTVIDDDLGRSGSGASERPGFQKPAAAVCTGSIGAVFCIEASRLSRNGRDWHHLIDLCALAGSLVIDLDGAYDPRLIDDRLLLGLKGTMSEYELSLLRQRGLAARDAKAERGELRFTLPPGYCWGASGRIEIDPDERVAGAIQLVFEKFRELGSGRQVHLWFLDSGLSLPVVRRNLGARQIEWRPAAYHSVHQILKNPIYAGAYVFGRRGTRTKIVDGRARKSGGHQRAMADWGVLLRDNHEGYITWERFEENQGMLLENAHLKKLTSRKSGRGGRALLTGLVRCGRCGRMMQVSYGSGSDRAYRYQCRGSSQLPGLCVGIGGVRIDRALTTRILDAVSPHAVEAALRAAEQVDRAAAERRRAVERELEEAQYEASLAARRHELVDPAKRHVARELEARWNTALERVEQIEQRLVGLDAERASHPRIDQAALFALAQDLPAVWNAPTTSTGTKQRLIRTLIEEVIIDLDDEANEAVVTIHWVGGRHSETRVPRVRIRRYPADPRPAAADVMRKLGGQWPDRELAVTMNRMRCRSEDGRTWTTVQVRDLRERLGIAVFDPETAGAETVSADEAAHRLGVSVESVRRLIREEKLPATQLMPLAPWKIPVEGLESEAVGIGVREIIARRPGNVRQTQDVSTLRLPGI